MTEALTIEIIRVPCGVFQVLVASLSGNLQFGQSTDYLKTTVMDNLSPETKGVVINMTQVGIVDSSGVGILAALTSRLAGKGAALVLTGIRPNLQSIFDLSGMGDLFLCMETPEQAMDYFLARVRRSKPV